MRAIDDAERRSRLGRRHLLAGGADAHRSFEDVARRLVGLHASDPATVFLAARARVPGRTVADLERALYDDRTLLKVLAMRRTMFVVPLDLVPVLQASCTDTIAGQQLRRLVTELTKTELGAGAETWLDGVLAATLAALEARGSATGTQLSTDVPDLRRKLVMGEGKTWGAEISITTQVLTILSAQGHIVRGRPRGSLISSQYEWVATDHWLDAEPEPMAAEAARVELVQRWLAAFGPATLDDVQWWTGWGKGVTKAALSALDVAEVALAGDRVGLVLADDLEPVTAPDPWVALLPSLDPTAMGWKERDWYLGPHRARLFDRNGNIGPTAWCDGRIVGGWAQRPDGEVVVHLLEDVGAEASTALAEAAEDVRSWLGDVVVKARFPTPLERELMA